MEKNPPASAGDTVDAGLITGLGRAPGEENGSPLQNSCLENPMNRRTLVGYSPWGHKESDMTERLSTHTHTHDKSHSFNAIFAGVNHSGGF